MKQSNTKNLELCLMPTDFALVSPNISRSVIVIFSKMNCLVQVIFYLTRLAIASFVFSLSIAFLSLVIQFLQWFRDHWLFCLCFQSCLFFCPLLVALSVIYVLFRRKNLVFRLWSCQMTKEVRLFDVCFSSLPGKAALLLLTFRQTNTCT